MIYEDSLWFHGTDYKFWQTQLEKNNGIYSPKKPIEVFRNCVGVSLIRSMKGAITHKSDPIILITSSNLVGDRIRDHNGALVIRGGLNNEECLLMRVPYGAREALGWNQDASKKRIEELLRDQELFDIPPSFDLARVMEFSYD